MTFKYLRDSLNRDGTVKLTGIFRSAISMIDDCKRVYILEKFEKKFLEGRKKKLQPLNMQELNIDRLVHCWRREMITCFFLNLSFPTN